MSRSVSKFGQLLIPRKEQKAKYYQQYYQDNPNPFKQSMQRRQQIKVGLSCKRCGFNDWRALDFHHTNGHQKDFSIANAISHAYGPERILQEIAKCEVLCSNCHRILHWEEKYG